MSCTNFSISFARASKQLGIIVCGGQVDVTSFISTFKHLEVHLETTGKPGHHKIYAVNIQLSQSIKMRDQIELGFAFSGDFGHFCFDKHVVSVER